MWRQLVASDGGDNPKVQYKPKVNNNNLNKNNEGCIQCNIANEIIILNILIIMTPTIIQKSLFKVCRVVAAQQTLITPSRDT